MNTKRFTTPHELQKEEGISLVTQWRDRYPRGPLEFYRICGRIKYSQEQLENYFEAKRVGRKADLDKMK